MKCPLGDRPLERAWGEPLPGGWETQLFPGKTGSSGENLSTAMQSLASHLRIHEYILAFAYVSGVLRQGLSVRLVSPK